MNSFFGSKRWRYSISLLLSAHLIWLLGAITVAQAQDKRLSQADLEKLIQLGIGEDAIVAKIKADGIKFAVDPQTLEALKQAGATPAVLDAARAQSDSTPPGNSTNPPIAFDDLLKLVKLGIGEQAILNRVKQSPAVYTLDAQQVAQLKAAGATDALIAALQTPRQISAQTREMITDLAIILDCSGSMRANTSDGKSKMEVAKQVVTQLVQNIPDGINVAFIVYGHEAFGGADDPRNCQAVKVARSLSPLDAAGKSSLANEIGKLAPVGATPIALSLRVAGEELAKHDAYCGLVLITDGLETCKGDPAGEAAKLAKNPKLSFGINVVGFDINADESRSLTAIAEAGHGKYYNAASAAELAEALGVIGKEIKAVAQPPVVVDTSRRALRIMQPSIELPPMQEVFLVEAGAADSPIFTKTASITKFGEYLNVPSSSKKYDVVWVPESGRHLYLMRDVTLSERKVVEVHPETLLGMIKVEGKGEVYHIFVMPEGNKPIGVYTPVAQVDSFDNTITVPVGSYDLYVYPKDSGMYLLEEGIKVEAGHLYKF